MPLLAICRGAQEVNVALGGSLHQAVHEVPGYADHRAPASSRPACSTADAHEVEVLPGGVLARIVDRPRFAVNSVHGQGVARLAPGLRVEARRRMAWSKPSRCDGAPGFNLCVQWHPEWLAADNPVSLQLARPSAPPAKHTATHTACADPLPRACRRARFTAA
jgi:putative glutamine amidotransferase